MLQNGPGPEPTKVRRMELIKAAVNVRPTFSSGGYAAMP
jgi:hypothetical protein